MENTIMIATAGEGAALPDGLVEKYFQGRATLSSDILDGTAMERDFQEGYSRGAFSVLVALEKSAPLGFCAVREERGVRQVAHVYLDEAAREGDAGRDLLLKVKDDFLGAGDLMCLTGIIIPYLCGIDGHDLISWGYQAYERCTMERDLMEVPEERDLPSGMEIVPLKEGYFWRCAEALYRAGKDSIDNVIRPGVFATPWACFSFLNHIKRNMFGAFDCAMSFVAREKEKVAGAIFGTLRPHGDGFMPALFVDPRYQGKGVGSALTVALLRKFKEMGLPRISLCVTASNMNAIGLYRRLGFEVTARFFEIQLMKAREPQ
ncbi:MAG: GNAT family N-acetyltransferase [Candidatus Eremiobacteraeota bacterium]|nr:GNAT family N-acetyltransferase [Candidatus Eremiobacteraeota bacterium]